MKRYLSEISTNEKIKELRERVYKTDNIVNQILECLYFLSEFSYTQIAHKRKTATNEIEDLVNKSIDDFGDDSFKQNLYIKEEIYFYFNAKYARSGFKIDGKDFSLLDDYRNSQNENPIFKKENILEKYLWNQEHSLKNVFKLQGTEQNNYKHMIGSCKKILSSLAPDDLKTEWLLYLLKAFAMYSVNNFSYISEANGELEKGFSNFYNYENSKLVMDVFDKYFIALYSNVDKVKNEHKIKENIQVIQTKLLIQIQEKRVQELFTKHKELLNNKINA